MPDIDPWGGKNPFLTEADSESTAKSSPSDNPWGDSNPFIIGNIEPEEKSTLGAFGKTLLRVPENLAASAITAIQGGEGPSITNRGIGDRFVNWVNERNKSLAKEYEGAGDFVPGVISKQDVSQLGPNLAFSGVSMAGALAGAAAGGIIPVPGTATVGSLAGAGVAAQRMQSYNTLKYPAIWPTH
jgi:hypothetical protein